jgi:iron complex outermembrane receptor protein
MSGPILACTMMKTARSLPRRAGRLLIVAFLAVGPAAAHAQTIPPEQLALISLEELMNLRITSAERKEERANDVSAAVFVITQDDIRRSGLTKLPEILRLAPGMQVDQVNANEWAVSVRGFNSVFSDKLLVLIDGRSLYNRGFSGVFWDSQNMMVSDIERIEVIRGPGGTAWGANAVNGVINIITKSAADTKGTSVELNAGTFDRASGAIRYGGALGQMDYRVYSQWSDHAGGLTGTGLSADDPWNALTTGGRIDWSRGADSVMAQGSYMDTTTRPGWTTLTGFREAAVKGGVSDLDEGFGLGRWTHRAAGGSLFQVQGSRTVTRRDEATLYQMEGITDVDAQYQRTVSARHEIVLGGGYRDSVLSTRQSFTLDIPSDTARVFNAFAQDEFSLRRDVTLTLGSKLEHDTFAGWGVLPSARVLWSIDPTRQRAWAAISRARRTPGAAYRAIRIYYGSTPGENGTPVVLGRVGSPALPAEELVELEGGYRVQLGATSSIDVAVFHGDYDHSTTMETLAQTFELSPAPAHVLLNSQYGSLLQVNSRGIEISAHWAPRPTWRLDGSYSSLRVTPHLDPASTDTAALQFDGNAPQHQWQLRSTTWLSSRLQVNGSLYQVGRLRQLDVPAYLRADARLEFKLTPHLAAIAVGQNLLQAEHAEYSTVHVGLAGSSVPRSGRAQLRWDF